MSGAIGEPIATQSTCRKKKR